MSGNDEMLFDAMFLLNSIFRELGLSQELQKRCQKQIQLYYTEKKGDRSLPPLVVATVLYFFSEQAGEPLSASAVTTASGISLRWFEKKHKQIRDTFD